MVQKKPGIILRVRHEGFEGTRAHINILSIYRIMSSSCFNRFTCHSFKVSITIPYAGRTLIL